MSRYISPGGKISMRILLVDQDVQVLALVFTLLEHYGHDVRTAISCKEALSITGELRPQVVITGIALLASSGFELAKELRQRTDCPDTFIVALTGQETLMPSTSWAAAGFNRVLRRPANIDDIVGVLDDVSAGRKSSLFVDR